MKKYVIMFLIVMASLLLQGCGGISYYSSNSNTCGGYGYSDFLGNRVGTSGWAEVNFVHAQTPVRAAVMAALKDADYYGDSPPAGEKHQGPYADHLVSKGYRLNLIGAQHVVDPYNNDNSQWVTYTKGCDIKFDVTVIDIQIAYRSPKKFVQVGMTILNLDTGTPQTLSVTVAGALTRDGWDIQSLQRSFR